MNTRNLEKLSVVLVTALLATTGCGPVDGDAAPSSAGQRKQAQESDNGLSFNGLSFNGLSFNGLSTSAFNNWFQDDPAAADLVMRYVVRCAVPEGQTRSYTPPASSTTYTWQGGLGLAPEWASGASATVQEQQVVSACLAAHANRYGHSLPFSVLGRSAPGTEIPATAAELEAFSRKESCFFGNLFAGQSIFVATGPEPLGPSESTTRACGGLLHGSSGAAASCAPMVHAGTCAALCTLSASGLFYESCTHDGVTYSRPITTRLRVEDVYTCGDGTRQITEKCGTSYRWDNCGLDWGSCAP